jgi:hypothetical protein
MLDIATVCARMEVSAAAISTLVLDVTPEQARWKPDADSWSMLEVICHLLDEEREDFRLRLDLTLHQPEATVPPIAPEQWVTERQYNSRDLPKVLAEWLAERQKSLEWLRGLPAPDWSRTCAHPRLADMHAGDFLLSWAAHDLLHLRQLTELRWQMLAQDAAPFSTAYAGPW